jgi:S1-C subfamily serine protease
VLRGTARTTDGRRGRWAALLPLLAAGALGACGEDEPTPREAPQAGGRAAGGVEERVARSTVALTAQIGQDVVTSSGVVLDAERGLVLTTAHTVWGARSLKIGTELGTLHGRLVARAACDGLALVETHPRLPGLVPLRLAPAAATAAEGLRAFGWRFAVGRPQSLESQAVTAARPVRDASVDPDLPRLEEALALPSPVDAGASGGPLVDREGRLVGLLQPEAAGRRGLALPVARIRERLGELRPGPRRVYVGWEEQYACGERLTAFAARRHPGFTAADAALNAPVPASRLPGVGDVEPQ